MSTISLPPLDIHANDLYDVTVGKIKTSLNSLLKALNSAFQVYDGVTTATVVTLSAAASGTLIAANSTRKGLRWMNIGLNPVTVVTGAGPAVVGQGMAYSGAQSAGQQGGSESFEGVVVPTDAFQAISTLGTSLIVWEIN